MSEPLQVITYPAGKLAELPDKDVYAMLHVIVVLPQDALRRKSELVESVGDLESLNAVREGLMYVLVTLGILKKQPAKARMPGWGREKEASKT